MAAGVAPDKLYPLDVDRAFKKLEEIKPHITVWWTSGAQSAQLLKDSAGRYLFTSSTGVYYPYLSRGLDESVAPHLDVKDPKDFSETYGVSKAKCEREVPNDFSQPLRHRHPKTRTESFSKRGIFDGSSTT